MESFLLCYDLCMIVLTWISSYIITTIPISTRMRDNIGPSPLVLMTFSCCLHREGLEARGEVVRLAGPLANALGDMQTISQDLLQCQTQRQTDIWAIVSTPVWVPLALSMTDVSLAEGFGLFGNVVSWLVRWEKHKFYLNCIALGNLPHFHDWTLVRKYGMPPRPLTRVKKDESFSWSQFNIFPIKQCKSEVKVNLHVYSCFEIV